MSKILVVAEAKGGAVRKPTLELLSQLRKDSHGAEAVLIGSGVRQHADLLAGHGAAKVYVADDAGLANFALDRYLAALADAAGQAKPDMIWLSASELGKALGPAAAARLGGAFVSDCAGVSVSGET